ncbi:MAG TPA: hypothetical protein VFO58_00925, partial [Vicinamibacterales bacterium]|nr:hypothetical protein [Vicinamibacterales bacterium]
DRRLVTVSVAVVATDPLSGVSGFTLVAATSDQPHDAAIQGWTIGTADTTGQLRAVLGTGGVARGYSLRYQVADRAGNRASCIANVSVPPLDQRRDSDR